MSSNDLEARGSELEQQIRELQLQQQQLELKLDRYKGLLDNAMLGYLWLDRLGYIFDFNPRAAELLGRTAEALTGVHLISRFAPDAGPALQDHFAQVFATGQPGAGEFRLQPDKPGRIRWLRLDTHLCADSATEAYCITSLLDVTEQQLAIQAYRASEARYRLVNDNLNELILICDREGLCHFMNRRTAALFGGTPEHFIGKYFHELCPEIAQRYTQRIRDIMATGKSMTCEDEFLFPQGNRRLFTRVQPIVDEQGVINTTLIVSQDVTEQRSTERAMRRNEERLKALINATTDDVVVLLDSDLRMEIVNERAARGFGQTVPQMTGRPIGDFMPAEIAQTRREYAHKVIESGCTFRFEDQRAGRWFDNNMCPVFDDEGKPQAVAIFARDITQRKKMEQALAVAKEVAEKANLAKSRFLAAANHDLRQPLQAMRLLLESLSLYRLEPRAGEVVEDMKQAMQFMEGLLSALLDISKLEAGSVVPKRKHFHMVPFLHRLRSQFKTTAKDAGKQIRLFTSNAVLHTDPILLVRILQNFVTNAIRHARGERILVGCRYAKGYRRIEVWDDGQGIPNDQLDKIFEEFYQIGNPARNLNQGLGLGLAITRRIADLLELQIGVRSRPGRGSVFWVEVPLGVENQPVDTDHPHNSDPTERPKGLILVVDDDPIVLNATKKLLEALHYDAIFAANAEEVMELVKRHGANLRMALLDYRLAGGWDGIQLLKIVREILNRELPAVLISGDTSIDRLKQVQASGLPLLHKPIDPAVLRRHMDEMMSGEVRDLDLD